MCLLRVERSEMIDTNHIVAYKTFTSDNLLVEGRWYTANIRPLTAVEIDECYASGFHAYLEPREFTRPVWLRGWITHGVEHMNGEFVSVAVGSEMMIPPLGREDV